MATIKNIAEDKQAERINVFVDFEGKEEVFHFMPDATKERILETLTIRKKELEATAEKLSTITEELTKLIGQEI